MAVDPAPTRTILVVDDELPIRLALNRLLAEAGYTVLGYDIVPDRCIGAESICSSWSASATRTWCGSS